MAALIQLLTAYILGGITFIPLLVLLVLVYSYVALPHVLDANRKQIVAADESKSPNVSDAADSLVTSSGYSGSAPIEKKFTQPASEPEVAAGYFAVLREYVANGVNGKPPERTTPAGETIASESPSVYQNMYRSIFNHSKTQSPSFEGGKPVKRARNVFYVVLRHGHLLLFDNREQVEVRHVISLAHHHVELYDGSQTPVEGELFVKRNCIRLQREQKLDGLEKAPRPYFLFSDNCSDKEDFYHSLLHAQAKFGESPEKPPSSLSFGTEDMIKLVRQLHATDETSQTRWLNALVGRVFLALYRTPELEDIVRAKILKKMARVPRPAFLSSLSLDSIDLGHSAPIFSNPKLREMTVDGSLTIEMDVRYSGEFKAVIAAVARIELGSRIRAREVNLVLAGILRKLSGHILIRIKPPPSNRFWVSFETVPKMDLTIEPVVSSRQITYGLILRAIESRIKEVMAETIVLPNWDDVPFTNTAGQRFRGGIWDRSEEPVDGRYSHSDGSYVPPNTDKKEDNTLMPDIDSNSPERLNAVADTSTDALSDGAEIHGTADPSEPITVTLNVKDDGKDTKYSNHEEASSLEPQEGRSPPRAIRSNSFATAAQPVITTGPVGGDSNRKILIKSRRNAEDSMRVLSSRSSEAQLSSHHSSKQQSPPLRRSSSRETNIHDIYRPDSSKGPPADSQSASSGSQSLTSLEMIDPNRGFSTESPPLPTSDLLADMRQSPGPTAKQILNDKKATLNQSINSATNAAKKWGFNVLTRQSDLNGSPVAKGSRSISSSVLSQPMGRGQPLPPPGMPLPGPDKNSFSSTLRRKPVPNAVPVILHRSSDTPSEDSESKKSEDESVFGRDKNQRWKD